MKPGVAIFALFLFSVVPSAAQELVIYTIPSPVRFNWKSPHTLFVSYLENMLRFPDYPGDKHPMGHMLVELKDSSHYALVGAAPRDPSQLRRAVLSEKRGLGSLFTRYLGVLETKDKNLRQAYDRYPYGDIAFIRVLVSQSMFDRLWQYLHEYRKQGFDTIYNGNNQPRQGTGAGCSAFAVSFLEVGNLLDSSTLASWRINLDIQSKLIGDPDKEKKISIWRLASTQRWAKEGRHRYQTITYYEPTFVFNWISEKAKKQETEFQYKIEFRQQAPGIVLDRRGYPTPTDEIWDTEPSE